MPTTSQADAYLIEPDGVSGLVGYTQHSTVNVEFFVMMLAR
jgi:hypothetical protein